MVPVTSQCLGRCSGYESSWQQYPVKWVVKLGSEKGTWADRQTCSSPWQDARYFHLEVHRAKTMEDTPTTELLGALGS